MEKVGTIMFKIFRNKDEDNLKLSAELLKGFSLGFQPNSKEAIRFIEKATNNEEIADKIISLCMENDTPKAYHYIASAYGFKGVKFRPKVIEFLNKFLQNPIFEDTDKHYSTQQFYDIKSKEIELSIVYESLGRAYEGEYEFEEALSCYLKSYEINPYDTPIYCCLAGVYSKMHDLDKAISLLKEAKYSRYYKVLKWTNIIGEKCTDDTFSKVIDNQLMDYEGKKERGYVYKSRKNKK